MLRKPTDRCRTSLVAVSGIKTAGARDAELLLSNMAPPIRVAYYYAHARREGAISVAFVRPSVAYMANNSRTQRPIVPKFGRKVPHL